MSDADYLIRVPAEWITVEDGKAWIDADRLSGQDGCPFEIAGRMPPEDDLLTNCKLAVMDTMG